MEKGRREGDKSERDMGEKEGKKGRRQEGGTRWKEGSERGREKERKGDPRQGGGNRHSGRMETAKVAMHPTTMKEGRRAPYNRIVENGALLRGCRRP